jgi:hypothetical protein
VRRDHGLDTALKHNDNEETRMKWLKRAGVGVLALLLLASATFFAVGGREGVLLLFVRHVLRTDYPAPRDVAWKQGPAQAPAGQRPPNVVVILADDLGFNDVSFYGGGIANGSVPTPHIDSIGREGVNFPAGYAGNATCSPSRAAIMTGRYATRFGFEFTPVPVQFMRLIGNHVGKDALRGPVYFADREKDMPAMKIWACPRRKSPLPNSSRAPGTTRCIWANGIWATARNTAPMPTVLPSPCP